MRCFSALSSGLTPPTPPPPMKHARRAAAAGHKTTQRRRRPPVRRRTALRQRRIQPLSVAQVGLQVWGVRAAAVRPRQTAHGRWVCRDDATPRSGTLRSVRSRLGHRRRQRQNQPRRRPQRRPRWCSANVRRNGCRYRNPVDPAAVYHGDVLRYLVRRPTTGNQRLPI